MSNSLSFFFLSAVITWLNRQLSEVQLAKKLDTPAGAHAAGRAAASPLGMVRWSCKEQAGEAGSSC